MNPEPEKRRRLSLTKKQLEQEVGRDLLSLLQVVTADGRLSDTEITRLAGWLKSRDDSDLPGVRHLAEIVRSILTDGTISETERAELHEVIEKVMPPRERDVSFNARIALEEADEKLAEDASQAAENEAYLAEFSAKFDGHMRDLIMEGKLDSDLSEKDRTKLFAAAQKDAQNQPLLDDLIPVVCPQAMSETWRAEVREMRKLERADRDQWERENHRGKYAPSIAPAKINKPRAPNEETATEKQKDYLRSLGVRDEGFINSLGKKQASAAIDEALRLREKPSVATTTILWLFTAFVVVITLVLAGAWFRSTRTESAAQNSSTDSRPKPIEKADSIQAPQAALDQQTQGFSPPEQGASLTIEVSGIFGGSVPRAVINGTTYREGDTLSGGDILVVKEINPETRTVVISDKAGNKFTRTLR